MADVQKTIEVLFSGDAGNLTGVIGGISGEINDLGGSIKDAAQPFADLGDAVLQTDAALAALVAGGLALAINESRKFGTSFGEVSTLIDASAADIDQFRDDLLDYAADSGKSLADITQSTYDAISAGIDYQTAIESLGVAEKLSIGGKADLSASVKLLAGTLNAYGESTDQATRYSDIFFQTVKLGQTNIPQLAQYLSQVTGTAAAAGVPIETLTAAIAALTAAGAPTSQAITGIKAAISNIISPSKQAQDTAAALGLQFNATALQTKGFDGVLQDVYRATGGNTEQITRLFGSVEAFNAVATLGADRSGKFAEALTAMGSSAGSTQTAYAKMAEEIDLVNQRLANNIQIAGVKIGDQFKQTYSDVAGGLTDLFGSISAQIDSGTFDPVFDLVRKFGDQLADFLKSIATTVPDAFDLIDFSGLIDSIQALGDSVGGVFQNFDPEDPRDVADAIQFLIDSVETLVRVSDGMVETFVPVIRSFVAWAEGVNAADDATKEQFGTILAGAELIVKAGFKIIAALVAVGENAEPITRTFTIVTSTISYLYDTLLAGIQVITLAVLQSIENMVRALKYTPVGLVFGDDLKASLAAINRWESEVSKRFNNTTAAARENLTSLGKAIAGTSDDLDNSAVKIGRSFKTIPESANSAVKKTVYPLEYYQQIVSNAKDTTVGSLQAIQRSFDFIEVDGQRISTPFKEVKKAATEVLPKLEDITRAATESAGSIANSFGATESTIASLIQSLTDAESFSEQNTIEEAISSAESRARDLLDLQEELIDSQLRTNEAIRDSVASGGGVISVNAEGLAPELQAVIFKMLELIQIRANESGAEYLLGVS